MPSSFWPILAGCSEFIRLWVRYGGDVCLLATTDDTADDVPEQLAALEGGAAGAKGGAGAKGAGGAKGDYLDDVPEVVEVRPIHVGSCSMFIHGQARQLRNMPAIESTKLEGKAGALC